MTKTHTRLCTLVYRGTCPENSAPTFVRRPVKKTHRFSQRGVEGIQQITVPRTKQILERLIEGSVADKQTNQSQELTVMRAKPSWEEKVNRKRALIAKCIANYPGKSAAWISRHTGTDLQTVQKTKVVLQGGMQLEPYTYNNTKPEALLEEVRTHCATVTDSFETLTDLKRRFPSFSRKKLAEVLKGHGCASRACATVCHRLRVSAGKSDDGAAAGHKTAADYRALAGSRYAASHED